MKFQRNITEIGLLFAGISSVIGSGWLFGPLYAAKIAGPAAIIAWVLGGILMLIIALTFAELGTTFPVAGGMIQFAQYSHGPLLSFLIGWMIWISSVAVAPVETLAILQYASNYIPGLITKVENTHVLTNIGILIAAFVMFIMCLINYFGIHIFNKSNNIITAIKLIVPMATIILLMSVSFTKSNLVITHFGGFAPYGLHGILTALPLGGIIYSFVGSNTVLQLAGETKNPQWSIPLALIGSMLFCIMLYTLLQIVFIGGLSPNALSNGWSGLHFEGDNGPFSGMVAALGFSWFVLVIYADAIISPFGTAFVFTASTARVGYGLSDIGFLPASLKKLTAKGVPSRALLLNYVVGLLLFLPFPAWQKLVSFIISCFIVSYIVGPIALIALRKTRPDTHRPFKLPYSTAIALLAFYICNLLIFWSGWTTVYQMMIALSIGLVLFCFYCVRTRTNIFSHFYTTWWLIPYFILLTLISFLGTFGDGLGYIQFGWDFIVIAALTVVTFFVSTRNLNPA